mmetsp:Transcript_18380/g.42089  ORF Transcript_18380/g.42089 Transcript_18380/m.42089 type:complete len:125 (+) Transcript_18380:117-491(+)
MVGVESSFISHNSGDGGAIAAAAAGQLSSSQAADDEAPRKTNLSEMGGASFISTASAPSAPGGNPPVGYPTTNMNNNEMKFGGMSEEEIEHLREVCTHLCCMCYGPQWVSNISDAVLLVLKSHC